MRSRLPRRILAYGALAVSVSVPLALNEWRPWVFSPVVWRLTTGGTLLGGPATGEGRVFLA